MSDDFKKKKKKISLRARAFKGAKFKRDGFDCAVAITSLHTYKSPTVQKAPPFFLIPHDKLYDTNWLSQARKRKQFFFSGRRGEEKKAGR